MVKNEIYRIRVTSDDYFLTYLLQGNKLRGFFSNTIETVFAEVVKCDDDIDNMIML